MDLMQQEALERIRQSVFISNMNQILKYRSSVEPAAALRAG